MNCATTPHLIPYVDKYLAAVEKRGSSSKETTPVEASDRKAGKQEEAVPGYPIPEEERIALATELFGESVDDAELEVIEKVLTKEINEQKKRHETHFLSHPSEAKRMHISLSQKRSDAIILWRSLALPVISIRSSIYYRHIFILIKQLAVCNMLLRYSEY